MAGFSPALAEVRFGCGRSPVVAAPESVGDILAGLRGADTMPVRFPIEDFATFRVRMQKAQKIRREMRKTRGTEAFEPHRKARNLLNKEAREAMAVWHGQTLLRWVWTPQGFRERLVRFWGDHFTAYGKAGVIRRASSAYLDAAVRPHVAGRFEDLLIAAVTHPVMLDYLDQTRSMGPGSERAVKSGGKFGLNENLAREVLELHTLGVQGSYTQQDVRELAELLAGLSHEPAVGRKFRKDFAEPGAETVLGRSYGGDTPHVRDVEAVLRDLARHPDTAAHMARKLAVHFLGDKPSVAVVSALQAAFIESKGDLMSVYEALLSHPDAWARPMTNMRPPFDFVAASARALAVPSDAMAEFDEKAMRRNLLRPLRLMGQEWQRPGGPDGWTEEDSAWLTPQGLSARLRWAVTVPQVLQPDLPDPRRFALAALGDDLTPTVRFAAEAAESKTDAIGLVLTAPAFQRR